MVRHNLAWQLLLRDVWAETFSPFDAIFCGPADSTSKSYIQKTVDQRRAVHEISQVEMIEFADFGKRVTEKGGYLVLFISLDPFGEWYKVLHSHSYSTLSYP